MLDGVLGTQTWVERMVGADESTEPCVHPSIYGELGGKMSTAKGF